MSDNNKSNLEIDEWKEYKKFLQTHELQLYSMNFPTDKLGEKLYYKLKYDIFEPNLFKLTDNEEQEKFIVQMSKSFSAEQDVFLVDHCWTFKIRQFHDFVDSNPEIVNRVFNMLKYSDNPIPINSKYHVEKIKFSSLEDKSKYLKDLDEKRNSGQDLSFNQLKELYIINYDGLLKSDNDTIKSVYLSKLSFALSIEDNDIDLTDLKDFLLVNNQISLLWIDETIENMDSYELLKEINSLQFINRKFTGNGYDNAVKYLKNEYIPNMISEETDYYLNKVKKAEPWPNVLDLNSTNILTFEEENIEKIFELYSQEEKEKINTVDLSFTVIDESNKEKSLKNILLIFKHFNKTEKVLLNINTQDLYSLESNQDEAPLVDLNPLFEIIISAFPLISESSKLEYINDLSISKIISKCGNEISNDFNTKWQYYLKSTYVYKNMWKIIGSYRLVSEDKYDENITWYINDEVGSAITLNQSDTPNVKIFPFIFSKSNDFSKDSITYSILWPCKNINEKTILARDNLTNIGEDQQRSSKLTLWCNTPKEYFREMFLTKVQNLKKDEENHKELLFKYNSNLAKLKLMLTEDFNLYQSNQESKKSFDFSKYKEIILNTYDFFRLNKSFDNNKYSIDQREFIISKVIQNIIQSILNYDFDSGIFISSHLKSSLESKSIEEIKVLSDLPYVRDNISKPLVSIANPSTADIFWLNTNYYQYNPIPTSPEEPNSLNLKKVHFKNQFPYEAIICMKYHLMKVIQESKGFSDFYGLSYDLETELSQVIGNFYYNEEPYQVSDKSKPNEDISLSNIQLDNSWILKPINMARSIDMIVTNNLFEIIKSAETGPKICQKYIHKPFLMNKKKFDFRYMVVVKSIAPVEVYIYSKVFWFRSANNDYSVDCNSFTNYETHFTVMNYEKKDVMQQIFDYQFLEYLQSKNISYEEIYKNICDVIKEIFICVSYKCPQMIDPYAKAIYAIDVMID